MLKMMKKIKNARNLINTKNTPHIYFFIDFSNFVVDNTTHRNLLSNFYLFVNQ